MIAIISRFFFFQLILIWILKVFSIIVHRLLEALYWDYKASKAKTFTTYLFCCSVYIIVYMNLVINKVTCSFLGSPVWTGF